MPPERTPAACGFSRALVSSVSAAIAFLASLGGSRWLVFGDMGELGNASQCLHAEVGELARDAGIDRLFCVGSLSRSAADAFGSSAESHESIEALWNSLQQQLQPGLSILVKGSRFMGLEQVVKSLAAFAGEQDSED